MKKILLFTSFALCILFGASIVGIKYMRDQDDRQKRRFEEVLGVRMPHNEEERLLRISSVAHTLQAMKEAVSLLEKEIRDQLTEIKTFAPIEEGVYNEERARQLRTVRSYQDNLRKLADLNSLYAEATALASDAGFRDEAVQYGFRPTGGDGVFL